MIKKNNEQKIEVRNNMRGGSGEVKIKHHLVKEDFGAKCRLCAELTIGPGSGIGLHEHAGEDEIFIIQKGKGVVVDGNKETPVEEGDVILTGKGASHSITNTGNNDLVVTAIIIQY
jgi:mannose-6-phosphate isomerase-like protein (cupin superfamily)